MLQILLILLIIHLIGVGVGLYLLWWWFNELEWTDLAIAALSGWGGVVGIIIGIVIFSLQGKKRWRDRK